MIIIAVLLLPVLSVLLYGLDQVEDRWVARPPGPGSRHARPGKQRRTRAGGP
ncbi:hypothetical protein ACGFT2_22755 [Streptomyces sp. NPDC048514]|uniref:hypothetical protein n=1 Tax=Streptomyces sp. NPDC048514 TaxID=3365564 RepID=UPI00371D0A77